MGRPRSDPLARVRTASAIAAIFVAIIGASPVHGGEERPRERIDRERNRGDEVRSTHGKERRVDKKANTPQKTADVASSERSSSAVEARRSERDADRTVERKTKGSERDAAINWPPNGGFEHTVTRSEPLKKGDFVDRYGDRDLKGNDNGQYFAKAGTPFEQRSLPESYRSKPLHRYQVLKEVPATSGTTSPWFDQPGGAKQYKINRSATDLVRMNYMKEVR